ncbi:hypothetical protein BJY04DRAFT_100422 [Aspergillus karnatakaensis]|uniref:uncharacterized protein n=1 Tax=Aspergillus karnatakaensis TaxID=1810916 RepID=UPI003CCD296E
MESGDGFTPPSLRVLATQSVEIWARIMHGNSPWELVKLVVMYSGSITLPLHRDKDRTNKLGHETWIGLSSVSS